MGKVKGWRPFPLSSLPLGSLRSPILFCFTSFYAFSTPTAEPGSKLVSLKLTLTSINIFCRVVYGYLEEAASRKRQWRVGKLKWASQATGDKHALHVYALTIGYKGNIHKDFKYLFCKIPSKKKALCKSSFKEVWFECNVVGFFFSTDSKVGMINHPTITQFRNKRGQTLWTFA